MITAFLEFMHSSGTTGWIILFTGVISSTIMVERAYTLFVKYGLKFDDFMIKVQTLVLAKKADEALVLCAQMSDKPLAKAFKTILEKADRDDETIFQAHDIAMAETMPQYSRRIHYIAMLANVGTLLGLLGTVFGLIMSFRAVIDADAATKNAKLMAGISVSLNTTALGLIVAIPAMVVYAFLVARQNHLIEQTTEKCGKLAELLTGSHIPTLNRQNIFPDNVNKEKMGKAPPANTRMS